jgi:hypothetical protein
MKKAWIALAAVALLALPAAAGARHHKGGDVVKNAAKYCKSLYVQMGPDTFRQTYGGGHNAFGKCVSSRVHALLAARRAALASCKQELNAGQAKLRHEGGTSPQTGNGNGDHGALKKCVKDKTQNLTGDDRQAVVVAIKACLAERAQDPAAFAVKYDPSGDGHEALGHCVRAHLPQSGTGTEPGNANPGTTTPGGTTTSSGDTGRT